MVKTLLLFILFSTALQSQAAPADTSGYQTQRLKINSLLAERSSKFGQYDLSLNARTGIFGLQTKNDLKNSNEILRGIILNDNNIFRELKILMNYKDQEVQQVQSKASSNDKRIEGYMQAIKTLRDQNEALKDEAAELAERSSRSTYVIIALAGVLIAAVAYYYARLRKTNRS